MSPRLYLVGGGGHCRSCIDVVEASARHAIAGIVDAPGRIGEEVMGYRIVAADADLPRLAAEGAAFLVTLGQLKSPEGRIRLFRTLEALGAETPVVVAPSARIARDAEVGKGTVLMHYAVVNSGAKVGRNCIVNTRALVEHDAVVGDHCHVSTAAVVNGDARVGEGCFIGSGAVVLHGVEIGPGMVVGAGAVVTRDLREPGTYVGNPARKVGKT